MYNKFKMEFPALACNESFARMIASGFVIELNPTCEELSEIKTAISEAVTNSIIHGYGHDDGIITFEGEIKDKEVKFVVADSGKGIEDVQEARRPLFSGAADEERSGMGFTIMEAFMDKVEVESSLGHGTKVTLIKTIAPGVTLDEI